MGGLVGSYGTVVLSICGGLSATGVGTIPGVACLGIMGFLSAETLKNNLHESVKKYQYNDFLKTDLYELLAKNGVIKIIDINLYDDIYKNLKELKPDPLFGDSKECESLATKEELVAYAKKTQSKVTK